uniref:Uncharacterized protein n=1 Tax=Oryza glaberrima TaxID=4538 RepID=I1PVJ2_ORYGL
AAAAGDGGMETTGGPRWLTAVVVMAGDGGAVQQTARRRLRQHMKAGKELGGREGGDRERAWRGRRLRVAALHGSGGLRRARRLRGVEAGSGRVARWCFHTLTFGEAFASLGPLRFCGGRHALRLLLLMKSELLADGVRRCLATMTSCSLFQGVGADRVKEVSLWWFG